MAPAKAGQFSEMANDTSCTHFEKHFSIQVGNTDVGCKFSELHLQEFAGKKERAITPATSRISLGHYLVLVNNRHKINHARR